MTHTGLKTMGRMPYGSQAVEMLDQIECWSIAHIVRIRLEGET